MIFCQVSKQRLACLKYKGECVVSLAGNPRNSRRMVAMWSITTGTT